MVRMALVTIGVIGVNGRLDQMYPGSKARNAH